MQNLPWGEFPAPWEDENRIVVDPELKQVYEAHITIYLEYHRIGTLQSIYNFPIQNSFTLEDIRENLNNIYNIQTKSFKLNVKFGLILKSVVDDDGGNTEHGCVLRMTICLREICILVRKCIWKEL